MLGLALIYLLTWTGAADRQTHLKRLQLHRRLRLGHGHGASTRERVLARSRPGFGSAIAVHSPAGEEEEEEEDVQAAARRARPLMQQDEAAPGARARVARMPSSAGSPNLLASFAGKNRVLVISAPHDSDGYYRLMMSLLKPDVYCELAERHVHQIVMFHQEGEMGGKVRRITTEGKVMEEPLDTALIPRLMSFLKLEKGE